MVYRFTMCGGIFYPILMGQGSIVMCALCGQCMACVYTPVFVCVLTPVYVYIGTSGTIPII